MKAFGRIARDLITSPRSFTKPRAVDTAEAPVVGGVAPPLPMLDGERAIVAFLRHVGCPFAEKTLRELARLGELHPSTAFIAVTHSPHEPTRAWCAAFGGAGVVRLVADPDRAHYGAWGVGVGDRAHFGGRESMASLRVLAAEGIHNRRASGSRWQTAATFAVADGVIVWRHLPAHAGDLPPLNAAITALQPR
ncbi:hypothetical protein NLX83_38015 [Allokutzneria sp. A3M-2-11 16]|uniref:AhpC/TSA family protein n=1 Tax=Allokutzneria sp. A3M-2-11 16 TaxID=2962043 RepID=UPI0020B68FB5|nr:AhpC/TSA family protein [Allokutzneria sp. A3M-2-11 16]MCP3805078.1 hypothetical protein [Allokutzneria sp. A3M-2-11 16]